MVSRKVNRKLKRKQTKVKRALNKKKQTFKLNKNFRVKRISKKNIKLKSIQNYQSIGGANGTNVDGRSARSTHKIRQAKHTADKMPSMDPVEGMKKSIRALKKRIGPVQPITAEVVGVERHAIGKMETKPPPAEFDKALGQARLVDEDDETAEVNVLGIVENEDQKMLRIGGKRKRRGTRRKKIKQEKKH